MRPPSVRSRCVVELQWSRDLSTTEIVCQLRRIVTTRLLQWSRDLSTTEMLNGRIVCSAVPSFNGAVIFRPRKCASWEGARHVAWVASMEP